MVQKEWPEPLVRDIARRRAILVIGSGVSRHAVAANGDKRPPVWKDFLNNAVQRFPREEKTDHIYKAIEDGDLLHACEWLKNRYDEDWTAYLRSQFVDPNYRPGELHRLIADLDTRIVFSLNFDDIYENKSREVYQTSQFTKNYSDSDVCEFLRGDARYIVKVHGNLSSPDSLIFTREDYARARIAHSLFYSAFDAALMTHTFLFIGCGYNDPDINLLLENQAFRVYSKSARPHYFLSSDDISHDMKRSLRNNRNLKTLSYDRVDENHSGLIDAIRRLTEEVAKAKDDITENGNW